VTAIEWITGFIATLYSPMLLYPFMGFVVWAVFTVRISRRHHLTMEDMVLRSSEESN